MNVSRVSLLGLAVIAALTFAGVRHASAQDLGAAGPFAPGWRTVTVTRPGGSTFTSRLFYPAVAPGQNASIVSVASAAAVGVGAFPAVSFGHGFLQAVTQYQSTCEHLATWGVLVIAPESEGGLTPNHANFALDLRHALTYLEQRNEDAASDLFGRVDVQKFGLSGHSMGGGASMLAAAADSRVRIVANLAAAETNPSAVAASASIRCPVFLITGSQDTITPPASHGNLMYAALVSPRQQPVIVGGFHCGFTDAGFLFCDSGSITRAQQLLITRRLLAAAFLHHFDSPLGGAGAAWRAVWGPDRAQPGVNVSATDPRCVVSAVAPPLPPGSVRHLQVTISNHLSEPAVFVVEAEWTGAAPPGWQIGPASTVGPLAPGTQAAANIEVGAAGFDQWPQQQSVLISARPVDSPASPARGFVAATVSHTACAPDWNADGMLGVSDIFAFLASWFAGAADFDGDGQTLVADIFAYLGAWFAGCG